MWIGERVCFFLVKEVTNIQVLAAILGCEVGSLPTTYLGLSLDSKYISESFGCDFGQVWKKIGKVEELISFIIGKGDLGG